MAGRRTASTLLAEGDPVPCKPLQPDAHLVEKEVIVAECKDGCLPPLP